eukprot:GHVO01070583.1.p3 GENE.GHVO01070583.1~~GHVO01070583.1.p3  ORF type:complete len:192 (+),score=3.26 GHVO01070583.1:1095-1670(+)
MADITKNPLMQMMDNNFKYNIDKVHTSIPAKVVSYDADTQQATVEIVVSSLDVKTLVVAVPVQQYGGSSWIIDIEVNKDDTGIVIFSKESIENWLIDGREGVPDKDHTFNLNDAVFIPGFRNEPNKYDADNNGITLRNKAGTIKLKLTDSGLELEGGDLIVDNQPFSTHTHDAGTYVSGAEPVTGISGAVT